MPGGIAQTLFLLGRYLNISEARALGMPLVKLWQYEHCALLSVGANTEWRDQKMTLRERAAILKKLRKEKNNS